MTMRAIGLLLSLAAFVACNDQHDSAVTEAPPALAPAESPPASGGDAPSPPTKAAMPTATAAAVSAIGEGAVDPQGREGKSIGLAVGVWTPAYEITLGFGATHAGGGAVPDGDTVFEIGSVTKVFTGMLLADGVLAGRVKLDNPLSDHLPEAPIQPFEGKPVTLAHLASHGTGLPSMPDNTVGDRYNPGAGYTRELLGDFLRRTPLNQVPGSAYRYSNVGIGLLGMALSKNAGGASYEAMLADRIIGPLQMNDTRIDRATYPTARLAQGHQGTTPIPPNRIDVLESAGGLRSTARDMVKLVGLHAGTGHALDEVATLVQTKVIDKPQGGSCGLALEIRTEAGVTYFEKGGATSGFTAHIVVTRQPALGVVVLANSAKADVNGVAHRVHDAVRGGT